MVLASVVWAAAAASPPAHIPSPLEITDQLDCGGGQVMAGSGIGDFVTPSNPEEREKNPDGAVDRFLEKIYPGALREGAFSRVLDPRLPQVLTGADQPVARYEALSVAGRPAAVLSVAEQDGVYYVGEFSLCEHLAMRWAR
ncbi:MAG: hypothetical protein ACT4QG_12440 [Sporichthyaceae bacterium]